MSQIRLKQTAGFLVLLLAAMLSSACMIADEPKHPTGKKPAEAKQQKDMYDVPVGTVDELLEFIVRIRSYEPTSYTDLATYRKKAPAALEAAGKKLLELETDKSSAAYQQATNVVLEMKAVRIGSAEVKKQATIDEIFAHLAGKSQFEIHDLQLAMTLAQALEFSDNTALAGQTYARFGTLFTKSDNELFAKYGEQMQASGRRLNLLGDEMQLQGKTLDGNPFDLAALKGKVVLVDFWATWCGPCLEEIPHLRELYTQYHERGFEVVGISLDQNRLALREFVEKEEIPWTILHDESQMEGGQHPAAAYYGISSIPAMFLLNKEGKVVSLQARGETLQELLKAQFGAGESAAQ